ncbi:cell division protein FtsL [Donghicola tyrosinivorans]|uniref:Cell division protein FtsL n=1 Tax=Donghicola tyrosinivorans TaxID=1652492 RepID=A0A2T0WX07_9RHOB|nr:cell division protein FtsL [Donghicola tyrosinivorans]PRY91197.1 hypothetical protein CLV74_104218 [Donghicola tyrosinivorans]
MRTLFCLVTAIAVMSLAYWAYGENYRTQASLDQARNVGRQITAQRERLAVLRAEWAYQNRPDRLRDLAELNFDSLGLLPMTPEHFGKVDQITYPLPKDDLTIEGTVEVSNMEDLQ